MEYPFSLGGNPAADASPIGRFPLLDCESYREQTVGDQMADSNSLLYFPSLCEGQRDLNEAVQAAASLAIAFDTVVRDERDESADFAVFGRTLLVSLALVELTVTFANEDDMTGHVALVRELCKRLARVEKQLGLVVDKQVDELLDTMNS